MADPSPEAGRGDPLAAELVRLLHELAARRGSPEIDLAAHLVGVALARRGGSQLLLRWQALTVRERLALDLVRRGLGAKQIAAAWGVAPGTVRAHLSRALRKLGLASRADWVSPPPAERDFRNFQDFDWPED